MPTDKQIAANQANAQKCTGPRSEKGKATSSMNALKTGLDAKNEIIERCESRQERDDLTAAYYARYAPINEDERYLVDTAIAHEWLQRRYLSVEANLWKKQYEISDSLGGAFHRASESFARVDRRLNSAHRNHANAMKRLHTLRAQRDADPLGDIPPGVAPRPTVAPQSLDTCPPTPATQPDAITEQNPPQNRPTDAAAKALNPELVSFRTFEDPAPAPPIAAPSEPLPPPGPINLTTDPAPSDII